MPVALAIWSIALQPGKKTKFVAQGDIRITNVTLGENLVDEASRTSIKFTYNTPQKIDDEEEVPPTTSTILCSLTPGKIEQAVMDLIIEEDDEYEFEVIGKNPVYISGNYVDQSSVPFNDEDEQDMDDDSSVDLQDVSSDVEIDPAELGIPSDDEEDNAHRFQEINDDDDEEEKKPKEEASSKKRPRESDAMEVEGELKLTKKQLKALKKQKAENGATVTKTEDETSKENGETKPSKKEKKEAKKEKEGGEEKFTELPSGLKFKDHKVGSGPSAKKGSKLGMRYIGKLENGTEFDSNKVGKPFKFVLGAGDVIKGWDEGIVGMKAGGERVLIVPPKLGYGGKASGKIPANSTLKFEVKLVELK